MLLSFDRVVAALSESIIRDHCSGAESANPRAYAAVASFLVDQHRLMPDYLRVPFRCLTLLFDAWALPFTGRPFHRASPAQRARQIGAWKGSVLGVRRDLVKFYESLSIFAWYAERSAQDDGAPPS
jgi:hypothetical protein